MEIELELEKYPSLNAFFTRRLRPGCRPIAKGADTLISPVDGQLSMLGKIDKGLLLQAKGHSYTLSELLQGLPFEKRFVNGKYCTFYLSPRNYHRIHFPCNAMVIAHSWLPGRLLPVNQAAVEQIDRLFVGNERLVSLLEHRRGLIAMVKVGAFNVGSIRVGYNRDLYTNRRANRHGLSKGYHQYAKALRFLRGEELGYFEMGSTVILLFERNCFRFAEHIRAPMSICYGEKIGTWNKRAN